MIMGEAILSQQREGRNPFLGNRILSFGLKVVEITLKQRQKPIELQFP